MLRRGHRGRHARGAVPPDLGDFSGRIHARVRLLAEARPRRGAADGEGAHEAERGDEKVHRRAAVLDKAREMH